MSSLLTRSTMVVALLSVIGCSSAMRIPGVGSVFVYERISWDTLGHIVDDRLDSEVVYRSGISYAGKDNVIVVSNIADRAVRDPIYYNYEPNGDFDDYSDVRGVRHGWRTYPVASKGTTYWVQVDSMVQDKVSGEPRHWFRQFVFSYLQDSVLFEAGQRLRASEIVLRAGNERVFQNGLTKVWIAPSIGMEVRSSTDIYPPYPQQYARWESHLLSYTLK